MVDLVGDLALLYGRHVRLMRTLAAPVEAVYAAWTRPEIMRRWLAPVVEADVRVGGRYRLEARGPGDGTGKVFSGQYLVLEPGRRIVQTFRNDAGPDKGFVGEHLVVTLRVLGPTRTELTLTNAWEGRLLTGPDLDALEGRWSAWMDQLEATVAPGALERRVS